MANTAAEALQLLNQQAAARAAKVLRTRHSDFAEWRPSEKAVAVAHLAATITLYALERAVLAVDQWHDEDGGMVAEHLAGEHTTTRAGCPECSGVV